MPLFLKKHTLAFTNQCRVSMNQTTDQIRLPRLINPFSAKCLKRIHSKEGILSSCCTLFSFTILGSWDFCFCLFLKGMMLNIAFCWKMWSFQLFAKLRSTKKKPVSLIWELQCLTGYLLSVLLCHLKHWGGSCSAAAQAFQPAAHSACSHSLRTKCPAPADHSKCLKITRHVA